VSLEKTGVVGGGKHQVILSRKILAVSARCGVEGGGSCYRMGGEKRRRGKETHEEEGDMKKLPFRKGKRWEGSST